MTRLDNVIKDIENVNKECHAWIYDANGNIKDNVICGNVLDLLYELKDYEIETFDTEKSIDLVVAHANKHWNTYCDGKYCVDIDIMSECYSVYDWELCESLGEFYEIEVEDLLNEIEERA